jgi:hypothetical protein
MAIIAKILPTSYTSQESLLKPKFLRNGKWKKYSLLILVKACQAFAIPNMFTIP